MLVTNFQEGKNEKTFRYFIDLSEDGFWQTEVIEAKSIRMYLTDTDKNGTADIIGYDYDNDGEIDKYQRFSG